MNKIIKEENIGNIGTLKVSKNLQELIDYLHLKVGAIEWSGILFYKLTKGNIDTLKDLEFTADFLYPMNIGTHSYTEFEFTGEIAHAYDIYEAGLECSTGLVHSHNNFSTFFSGTDSSELRDNASHYNYYVSLIVNFAHEYCAKIAIPTKTTIQSESWFKNTLGKLIPFKQQKEEEVLLIADLTVVIENSNTNPKWLVDRVVDLQEKKKVVVPTPGFGNLPNFDNFQSSKNRLSFERMDYDFENNWNKKRTSETTKLPTALDFLTSLVNLGEEDTDPLSQVLAEATMLLDTDQTREDYLEALDLNIEIIHENVYGSMFKFNDHCLEAVKELEKLPAHVKNSKVYTSIHELLMDYATL